MTTNAVRPKGTTLQRGLLVGGLVLVTMFLGRLYIVPIHSVFDGPFPAALMAASLAAGAWWVAFRWWRAEPDAGPSFGRVGLHRAVGLSLLAGAIAIPLFLFFRLFLLPLLPGLDGVLGAALAAGAAGGIAQWLVSYRSRS